MVESQPELEKIQVVSLNRAVVMNFNEGLTRLTANSKEPSVIFPANRALIRGFFFSDSLEGWAVGQTETKPNGMWDAVAYKTVDGGKRWQKIDLPEFHDCNCAFYDVLELPDDSVIFAGDVITTMKNDSNSAKIVEDGNSLEDKVLGHPSSVSISSDVVSVLTSRGNKYLVSFDMGSTWESRQLPGSDDLEALKYLDRTKVLALSGGWIFLSRDGGKSWERSAKPISNVHSLIQMPQSANIYAFGRVFAPINTNRLFDH